ncbi:Vam6/Vps39-like protein [Taenia crassiceps]|uniref:Vam6/Vps39-like protein n=1 Tax=Taenia crassiceps TaxID=6207 RepID=A0ABR4QPC3_9CEST
MSLETVHQEFEQIDTNHYGYITRADLEAYARRTHQDSDFVDKWFQWFEGEHKGIITMEDVCTTLGIPMREEYMQKVDQKRQMISQGLISAPPEAHKMFASPPLSSSTVAQKSWMKGVEVLPGNAASDDMVEKEKDMALFLKEQMERSYGKHWQVVVASSTIGCMKMHKVFYPIRLIRGTHYDFECITCFQNYLLVGTKSGQLLIYEITPSAPIHPDVFVPTVLGQEESALQKPLEFTSPVDLPTNKAFPPLPALNVRLCATHNLCKKRILQLEAISEYGFFLALTEFQLAAYNLSNRQLIAVVPNSKGATYFTIMYQSPTPVCKKNSSVNDAVNRFKRPLINTEEVHSPTKGCPLRLNLCIRAFVPPSEADDPSIAFWPSEYSIMEPARSLQFCGLETLMIASRSDYTRLNLVTRECERISASAKVSTTLMSPLPYCVDPITFSEIDSPKATTTNSTSDEPEVDNSRGNCSHKWVVGASAPFVFASDESFFILMPDDGDVKSTPTFTLSDIAQCIQVFPPFLLAGLPKQLEVRSLDPNLLVQTFTIPRIRSMCSNEHGWLYASAAASVYHPDDSQPCLSSDSTVAPSMSHGSDVWLLLSANRLQFVQELVRQKEFEMALRVSCFASISGQPAVTTNPIGALFAFHLFDTKRDFERALQLFYKLKTDPTLVIGLCPGLLSEEESAQLQYPSSPMPLADSERTALFEPLITFLVRWRNHLRCNRPQEMSLENFLEQHVSCGIILGCGIQQRRRRLLQVVDTSLLKCYQVTNVARIAPLLRRENYCLLEEAEGILKANNCMKDLVTLYKMHGMHREALHYLTSMVSDGDTAGNTAADGRLNYHSIVNYLKRLTGVPFDLVVEFGEDVLMQHPRAWMRIFAEWESQIRQNASASNKAEYYSLISYRERTIRYLERVAPHLLIPFLECILFSPCICEGGEEGLDALDVLNEEGDFGSSVFFDKGFSSPRSPSIIREVANGVDILVFSDSSTSNSESTPTLEGQWESTCIWPFPKHHHSHRRSTPCHICHRIEPEGDVSDGYTMPEICVPPPGFPPQVGLFDRYVRALINQIRLHTDDKVMTYCVADEKPTDGIVARLRTRLLRFLSMEGVQVSAEELLLHLPYDGCFEERTVLLARLKRHRQALTMWVHLLNNWDKALEHCALTQAKVEQQYVAMASGKNTKKDKENINLYEIYTVLVDVCLNPLEPIALGIVLPNSAQDAESSNADHSELDLRFEPRMDLALAVMRQFSELIDVTKVLHIIPDSTNLSLLSSFLESALRYQTSLWTRLVFFTSAVHRESVQSHNACVATTAAQMFNVTTLSRCRQCQRRIGNAAFVRYPDSGDLVHYGCCRDLPVDSDSPLLQR